MKKQILAVFSSVIILLSLTACGTLSDTSSLIDGQDKTSDTSDLKAEIGNGFSY